MLDEYTISTYIVALLCSWLIAMATSTKMCDLTTYWLTERPGRSTWLIGAVLQEDLTLLFHLRARFIIRQHAS